MSRISIDVSPQEHKKLKAMAALRGMTMKDFLLGDLLTDAKSDEMAALAELEELLEKRIEHHGKSGLKGRSSAKEIFQSALKKRD
ncbi:Antitoxin ParD [Rubritalea squalenifaciens DSM 18772]|uniref:Antitoxin ParD n=1 Tax=Rubritalea squalenifaciens DSM 18772 TaxID=1123071 RepID=A0A1M6RAI6_9BACT|nr:antitoxin [Rubritalea squalenifaciens]SHK29430.1 Antitoxin ParD [Rubritalea squalenifaciens DSM 18772]